MNTNPEMYRELDILRLVEVYTDKIEEILECAASDGLSIGIDGNYLIVYKDGYKEQIFINDMEN